MFLPKYLYRGDKDEHGVRKLREWRRGVLLTNLSNGGSGKDIFTLPLRDAIKKHIDIGWDKTHFLSFSASLARASLYAGERDGAKLIATKNSNWDTAIITIDTSVFNVNKEVAKGVYDCTFEARISDCSKDDVSEQVSYHIPRLISYSYRNDKPFKVLVIDVVECLGNISMQYAGYDAALRKANNDFEWLILPIDIANGIQDEYTSTLDIGCISRFETYNIAAINSVI